MRIDFLLASQGETIQSLVVAQISEHRLDRGEALAIQDAPLRTVYLALHLVGVTFLPRFAVEERDLLYLGFIRFEQTFVALCARHAVALCALELHRRIAVDGAVAAVAIELFARRADAGFCFRVVVEVAGLVACL